MNKSDIVSKALKSSEKELKDSTECTKKKDSGKNQVNIKNYEKMYNMESFEEMFTYEGNDLGCNYSKDSSVFKVWSPIAENINIRLYKTDSGGNPIKEIALNKGTQGVWEIKLKEDLKGLFYTYVVEIMGERKEAVDIYAKAVGTNGLRAMIIDLKDTNPTDWENDVKPAFLSPTDAIIYEAHIRDLSVDKDSGIKNKGKFLCLTEKGTENFKGLSTGIDHLVDLGITHIHLLPVFDFMSIDESNLSKNEFNWGYDPQNYNVPEGSYSTNPKDGTVRIREFKEMVKTLHQNGIRVIMDVVYNHTGLTVDSNFNKTMPKYYHRTKNNNFTDASGCGNETASERKMVRKFIVDSVAYWANEYHVDGFRFDLMGIHDIDTMNEIRRTLDKIDRSILIYGEGWTCNDSPYPASKRALKVNTYKMHGIASFSDDIRDAIKGHVFNEKEKGFVSGGEGFAESLKFGIVGCIAYQGIDFNKVKYSKKPWANTPAQTINYVSAHDNLTLWDKLSVSNPTDEHEDLIQMDKMANAIVMTSQGIPFIHAGDEMLRSKGGDENSYKSPDSVNSIKWELKSEYYDVYNYYKGLIAFRKKYDAFRMNNADEIRERLRFLTVGKELPDEKIVGFEIKGTKPNDELIVVIYNPSKEAVKIELEGDYNVYINGEKAGIAPIAKVKGNKLVVEPISVTVLVSY